MGGDVSGLREAAAVIERFVAGFDPSVVHGADAASLVGLFNRLERVCAAGRTLAARRVEETDAWRSSGERSARSWLASQTGTSLAEAGSVLATASRLSSLPSTESRFRSGELSESQASAVAGAASVAPGTETELLREAERSGVDGLRRRCQSVRSSALASEALARRRAVHESRYLRTWTSVDGAFEGRFRLTLDHGALVAAALDAHHERIFRAARAAGTRDSFEAMEADALVSVARAALRPAGAPAGRPSGAGTGPAAPMTPAGPTSGAGGQACPASAPVASVSPAERNGAAAGAGAGRSSSVEPAHAVDGAAAHEPDAATAHLAPDGAGLGGEGRPGLFDPGPPDPDPPDPDPPDPPELVGGPLAHVVLRVDYAAYKRGHTLPGETCEIENIGPVPVATARRYANDAIITAVLHDGEKIIDAVTIGRTIPTRLRAALVERDRTCAVPGCDQNRHLEIHHLVPVAEGGETSLNNTCRICPWHHDQITYNHATLTGTHPHWTYTPGTTPAPGPTDP